MTKYLITCTNNFGETLEYIKSFECEIDIIKWAHKNEKKIVSIELW